jgi:hypothetical protein
MNIFASNRLVLDLRGFTAQLAELLRLVLFMWRLFLGVSESAQHWMVPFNNKVGNMSIPKVAFTTDSYCPSCSAWPDDACYFFPKFRTINSEK